MVTEVTAVTFQQNLGEMLHRVQSSKDSILINEDGKPVAALVDPKLFERIQRLDSQFDKLRARIAAGFAGIPEQEGIAEINRICYEERHR